MSFKIDPKKVGSINEGGRKLKVGTHTYKITGATMAVVKSNPTGKEKQVVIDLCNGGDYTCKVFLSVMSANETVCNIAQKTLVAFFAAAGVGGILSPERLPSLVGKTVVVTAKETPGKGDKKDQSYVNISTVEAPDSDSDDSGSDDDDDSDDGDDDSSDDDADDSDSDDSGSDDDDDQDDTPPPAPRQKAPAPASKPAGKKKPWE